MRILFYIFLCLATLPVYSETEDETITKCIADLSSNDVKMRRRAVLILCKYTRNSVYRQLVPLLNDPDEKVRQSIVVGFIESRMMLRDATLPLMRRLGDTNVHTRRIVSSTLMPRLVFDLSYSGNLGRSDMKILRGALNDKDATVRKNMLINFFSLRRLIETGDFLHLLGDESSEIRLMALNKMSNFLSYDNLKPYLDKLVKDKSPKIRTQVLKNLGNFGRQGLSYLNVMAEDKEPSIAARAMAYTRNAEYLPRIQRIILDESSPSDLVLDLTMAISGWNDDSSKFVYSLLDNAGENRRYAALSALSRMSRDVEVKKLLKLIKDDSSRIRQLVFRYIVRKELSADAVSELSLSEYSDVRQFTLNYILRNYGKNKEILESLYDLMLDEELKIRAMAIRAVWECRTEDRYEILEQSLTDNDGEIRNLAAQLLLNSPDPKAKAIMDKFMKSNKKVNIQALQDLNKISNLHKLSREQPAGWRTEILKALKSKTEQLQHAAVDIIIKTRDAALVEGLRNHLDSSDSRDLQNYLYKRLSEEEE